MENLPPINEMYSSIKEQRDFTVTRRYEGNRSPAKMKTQPTKKGSYLDDQIKMHNSPGPANKSNLQNDWSKMVIRSHKYPDRKTYVDEIQAQTRKRNSPSPNSYNIKMGWPEKRNNNPHQSDKINFLDHSEYESTLTPGPGTYIVATKIVKKGKQFKHTENHSRQPIVDLRADMNTYDPVPAQYNTFKKYEKAPKITKNTTNEDEKKGQEKRKENKSPGPGQYQMINSWKGKDKLPKGSLSYMDKISKGVASTIYYH